MYIHIIWVGKIKDEYLQKGVEEYVKRLSKYMKIDMTEVSDEMKKGGLKEIVQKKECEKIEKSCREGVHYYLLDDRGNQLDSVAFSKEVFYNNGRTGKIGFIIGGVYGFSDLFKKNKNKLSFSKMTFTHQMIRLILLEQLYRAYTIFSGKIYHY